MSTLLLLVLALFFFLASPAGAAAITFDDLSGWGQLADGYGGIRWNRAFTFYDWEQHPFTAASGRTRVFTSCCSAGERRFQFLHPGVRFEGAAFAGLADAAVQLRLYYAGTLVHKSEELNPSEQPVFLKSGYQGPVDEVGVYSAANDYFVMDDITYHATPVPEPSSFALLGGAIPVAVLLARRPR